MKTPRIISGSAKGIRLRDVPGDSTRPITDKVKGALFNIIGQDISNERFLDLFGGTGSVGIEALSRGASFVQFIENNLKAHKTIQENLKYARLSDNARVTYIDAFKFIETCQSAAFFVIFIAPPQYKGLWKKAMLLLDQNASLLEDEGLIVVQLHPIEYEEVNLLNFVEYDHRQYGSTSLVFFEKKKRIS